MQITLTNIQQAQGSIYLAVFDAEASFLKDNKTCAQRVIPVKSKGALEVNLPELEPGKTYAVSCFHDVNGNGKLDTNFFGVPTEPYGFSNNARPTFRAPRWEEAKFVVAMDQEISIKLEKW